MYDGVKAMIKREKELAPKVTSAPAKVDAAPAKTAPVADPKAAAAPAKVEAAAPVKAADPPKAAPVADPKASAASLTVVKLGASVKAGPHLKKPEDITGLVEFPADTKSLLCKYLKPDVQTKYFG
jgi:hypothetical protein